MGAVLIPPLPPPKPSRYAARAFLFLHPVNSKPPQCQQLLQRAGHVINTTKALWRVES
jgi:hypothetical protein